MSRTETGGLTASGWGVVGSYQYRGTDGALYKVSFTADQNGYRPRSACYLEPSCSDCVAGYPRYQVRRRTSCPGGDSDISTEAGAGPSGDIGGDELREGFKLLSYS